jgi:hypothetical protein
MSSVQPVSQGDIPKAGVLCVAVAHNEATKMEDFLRHHRSLGVAHFLIVDDCSTDDTGRFLRTQSDVTLFAPNGTNYRDHKVEWRKDILDTYGHGRWVILPDMDELFVYPFHDTRGVSDLTAYLELEGAEAVFAPMVEMYADAPLDQSCYRRGESMLAAYPFFDTTGYRLISRKRRSKKHFPTPPLDMYGGPRERLFYDFKAQALSTPSCWALTHFAHIRRSMKPAPFEKAGNFLARLALTRKAPRPPLMMSKIALLKWRRGLTFPGGPHAVSQSLTLSKVWGALLHFKFIDLPADVAYRVRRGQHAGGARHYKKLEERGGFERSPFYEGSRRYTGWKDLLDCGLLRSRPGWDRSQPVLSLAPCGSVAKERLEWREAS